MSKKSYNVVGVMSGTSLDGIDFVLANFNFDKGWRYKILTSDTVAYPTSWMLKLKDLVHLSNIELKALDKEYTTFLANEIKDFISKHKECPIDFVASHGHTAKHEPNNNFTYQIGNLPSLADILQHKVICDFRTQDVALGGQGAPLVPIGDRLLFGEYDYCLNLGGFSNISFEENNNRIAFDVCPVNIVLNHYATKLGFDYDNEGQLASEGNLITELYTQLNDLEYYKLEYPKSLGLEWVKEHVFPLTENAYLTTKDVLRTLVEHIAYQIGQQFHDSNKNVLVTGGGAYNSFLMHRIKAFSASTLTIPNSDIVNYKEALVFAFLGVLKINNKVNCLKSVTGAQKDHSSGKIFIPN